MNPLLYTDFYKVGHYLDYPKRTTEVYSNITARKSRHPEINQLVVFGIQYFIYEYLIQRFNEGFFFRPKNEVIAEYDRIIKNTLGGPLPNYNHIAALHDLGYLPIRIKALPEGSRVPMRVPFLTIVNTLPEFYWVTNALESLMSAVIWQPCTSATIAYEFRRAMNQHAEATGMPKEFVDWQGHDFSFRGMSSLESAMVSGMGHLLSFKGTDTIPAIIGLEQYYSASVEHEVVGGSVPATEHSVMCAGGKEGEFETFKRLITEIHPKGILSIVSDTWDLWKVLTDYMPRLKKEIMARDGKIVIRPDSGDPVDILCGDPTMPLAVERKGVVELLADVFGTTVTPKGFKVLDSHVGVIYGDSINLQRERQIANRLADKGFASQVVLGIGSYTYQYNTRDTFGIAMKATHVIIKGESLDIYKTPVTDDGTKNSATGYLRVDKTPEGFVLKERCTKSEEEGGELEIVFENGYIMASSSLEDIRERLWPNLPQNPILEFAGDLSTLSE
jgi:nicotinamide phosphoribosyltransferase